MAISFAPMYDVTKAVGRSAPNLKSDVMLVHAPGVSLECATLTHEGDRARVTSPEGLAALADAIAEGVAAWQRND